MSDACTICGLGPEGHHDYAPPGRPSKACVCDAGTWVNPNAIPPVCAKYDGDAECYCAKCEHDRACHTGEAT